MNSKKSGGKTGKFLAFSIALSTLCGAFLPNKEAKADQVVNININNKEKGKEKESIKEKMLEWFKENVLESPKGAAIAEAVGLGGILTGKTIVTNSWEYNVRHCCAKAKKCLTNYNPASPNKFEITIKLNQISNSFALNINNLGYVPIELDDTGDVLGFFEALPEKVKIQNRDSEAIQKKIEIGNIISSIKIGNEKEDLSSCYSNFAEEEKYNDFESVILIIAMFNSELKRYSENLKDLESNREKKGRPNEMESLRTKMAIVKTFLSFYSLKIGRIFDKLSADMASLVVKKANVTLPKLTKISSEIL